MKTTTLVLIAASMSLMACPASNNKDGGTDSGTTPNDAGTPNAPSLGGQIDRMGRAGVNTALTDPFDISASVDGGTENGTKDLYNSESDPTTWAAQNTKEIEFNLAVLDSLDGTCGNQLAAAAGAPSANTYAALAGVLADDELYLDTTSGTCALYLAVEANFTQLAVNNGDCGGRTPTEDVIDETYSLLAVGAPTGVTDGVASDNSASLTTTTFPFLAAPN